MHLLPTQRTSTNTHGVKHVCCNARTRLISAPPDTPYYLNHLPCLELVQHSKTREWRPTVYPPGAGERISILESHRVSFKRAVLCVLAPEAGQQTSSERKSGFPTKISGILQEGGLCMSSTPYFRLFPLSFCLPSTLRHGLRRRRHR